MKKRRLVYAILFCILLLTEILIALFVRDRFVRPFFGDVLVTVLLCCFCRILIPRGLGALPVGVFMFATLVEIAQYFDVVKLLGLEGNAILSTLVGRTFSLLDLVCYGIGCLLFYIVERTIFER